MEVQLRDYVRITNPDIGYEGHVGIVMESASAVYSDGLPGDTRICSQWLVRFPQDTVAHTKKERAKVGVVEQWVPAAAVEFVSRPERPLLGE